MEWVEVYIKSGPDLTNMQLSNVRLDGAVNFAFPAESLKSGEYVIVTNNVDLFKQTYKNLPAGCRVFGPWDKDPKTGAVAKLVNEGDVVDVKIRGEGDASAAFGNAPQTVRAERLCIKVPATKRTRLLGGLVLLPMVIRAPRMTRSLKELRFV